MGASCGSALKPFEAFLYNEEDACPTSERQLVLSLPSTMTNA